MERKHIKPDKKVDEAKDQIQTSASITQYNTDTIIKYLQCPLKVK